MNRLFRPKTLFFGVLALGLGTTTGLVLAGQTIHAPGSLAVSLTGHSRIEASPEPSPQVEPADTPEAQPSASPEAEPAEAIEPAAEPEASPEPPEDPTPTPPSTAGTSPSTFSLVGGTVTLSCPPSGAIMVDSVTPNAGFTTEQGTEDGGSTVEIRFESSSHESRLQADCAGGQVQQLELREESN